MPKLLRFIERNYLQHRKSLWRVFNDYSPDAKPVFILGAQRSGTTLLLDCLEQSMELEVLGESSSAMVNFRIKDQQYLASRIASSRHKCVVFKPLTDSHRARDFLSLTPNAKAIWAFRRVEDRVNSSVAKFGDHNLQILRGFAKSEGLGKWQAQGLTEQDMKFIRRFDYSDMSPHEASALFWQLRNSLYFSQRLENCRRILPLAYEDLVSDPEKIMRGICRFIGATFDPSMIKGVHTASIGRSQSKLSEATVAMCAPVYDRLHEIQTDRWRELNLEA